MNDRWELERRISEGETFDFIFFWRPAPAQPGTVDASCLSQWYPSPFQVEGKEYATAEHFMMAGKARLFGDAEIEAEILANPDPRTAKALGGKVRNFDEAVWREHRVPIVVAGNVAKFTQHPELAAYLLGTAPDVLVEASPLDRIWGIGLGAESPHARDPKRWRGVNLLGFALMNARSQLA